MMILLHRKPIDRLQCSCYERYHLENGLLKIVLGDMPRVTQLQHIESSIALAILQFQSKLQLKPYKQMYSYLEKTIVDLKRISKPEEMFLRRVLAAKESAVLALFVYVR